MDDCTEWTRVQGADGALPREQAPQKNTQNCTNARNELDHGSLQIGIHVPKDLLAEEDRIRTRHGAGGSRPFKAAFTSAIKAYFAERTDG